MSYFSDIRSAWSTGGSALFYLIAYTGLSTVPLSAPLLFVFDAPFGHSAWSTSRLNLNANLAWWIMELVSPLTFLFALLSPQPLSSKPDWADWPLVTVWSRWQQLAPPIHTLATLYLIHYLNRSTISTLRQPSARSPMHLMTFLSAVVFNLANGYLMGAFLAGRTLPVVAASTFSLDKPNLYYLGIGLWVLGFVGNVYHDEILYDIRRRRDGPRYDIPHGGAYDRPWGGISYPNYFFEWIEWFGFALATSALLPVVPPLPARTSSTSFLGVAKTVWSKASQAWRPPSRSLRTTLSTPPWLFVYAEVATMLPRAVRGQAWYQRQFGQRFPVGRKAIIPGVW